MKLYSRQAEADPTAQPRSQGRGTTLGELLMARGVLTEAQLQEALAEQARSGRKLGRVLTDLGYVDQETVTEALQEQVRRIRIGDLLVDHGAISEADLERALTAQKQSGRKLGRVLMDLGLVEEPTLLRILAEQLDLPFIDLRHYRYNPEVVQRLPESLARRFRAIPLSEGHDGVLVGMADPTDLFAQDEIARALGQRPQLAIVGELDLLQTIDRVFRRSEEIATIAEELGQEIARADYDLDAIVQAEMQVDAPVVRLLQTLFEDAVQIGASDLHIEPDENALRLRQRVDGLLHEQVMKEHHIAPALISRLKLMAGLDISERRLPQDGRFNIRVHERSIDVRLSTLPLAHGESVVMRLLDQSGGILALDQLGMPEPLLKRFRRLLHYPYGMVLVTGPTGSGKTTTLYAALAELNEADRKIITVEDPVEYRLERICQVQVNPRIGLDFPRVLRTALRQGPDVLLVGEMRDGETAQIGIRAALTGHLMLSTLHTNNAVSTPLRLMDMGADGYLVAPSLLGVLAQRLIRRICPDCAEPAPLEPRQRAWVRGFLGGDADEAAFQRGRGCNRCNNTGYRGRIGVYELLEVDEAMSEALRRDDQEAFYQAFRAQSGFRTLTHAALDYARDGITTLDEVLRVAGEMDDDVLREADPA